MAKPNNKPTKHHNLSTIIGIVVCVVLFFSGFIVVYLQFASGHPNYTTIACSVFVSALVLFIAIRDLISGHTKH
jgi:uncharacterized membrane protein YjjP (DUF1212 family)